MGSSGSVTAPKVPQPVQFQVPTAAYANAAGFIPTPDPTNNIALAQAQSQLQANQLTQSGKLLGTEAGIKSQIYTPDIFGAGGSQEIAKNTAASDIANSRALEQQFSPDTAALREALPKDLNADLSGDYFKTLTPQLMAQLFGSGINPNSVIGKSGLFDATTAAGLAERHRAEQAAAQYLEQNRAPVAGIDPGAAASAVAGAKASNVANNNAFVQNVLQGANTQNQSTTDWINQLMGNVSNVTNANSADWQNYEQAMLQSATNQAAGQNALTAGTLQANAGLDSAAMQEQGALTGAAMQANASNNAASSGLMGSGVGALGGLGSAAIPLLML